jgi:hypothetical protein
MTPGKPIGGPAPAASDVQRLVDGAYGDPWNPSADLPWGAPVDWTTLRIPDALCLVSRVPAFRRLSAAQRESFKQREMASHLSRLSYGEQRAAALAAETLVLCPEERKPEGWFIGTLVADETKHAVALERYLHDKLRHAYPPHAALVEVFAGLSRTRDYDLNLFVGQVVLEGSAASLLTSLMVSLEEPLLRNMLRRIMRDEARHMRFAELVATASGKVFRGAQKRRMEELIFEAAYAGAACLIPTDVWDELSLPRASCLRATVDALKQRGVIRFYSKTVTRQLRRRGFPSERLEQLFDRHLEERLRAAA